MQTVARRLQASQGCHRAAIGRSSRRAVGLVGSRRYNSSIAFHEQQPIQTYDVLDPHDHSKILHKAHCVNVEEAQKAVEVAAKAFETWKDSPIALRQEIFRKASALLKENAQKFAEIEVQETTSSPGWAGFEMQLAAEGIFETAAAINYLRGETINTKGQRAIIERYPYGVILGMAPWNAPLTLGLRAVTNAIMAGNCAILKTSEFSPKVHAIIGTLFTQAGLPPGVLTIVNVAPKDAAEVVESIIAHPAVQKVNFTGSTAVGTKVAQVSAKHLKPCTLELGGAAPLIALRDADLAVTANAALFGSFFHSGQICMATNLVIAHESIAADLQEEMKKKLKELSSAKDGAPLRGLFSPTSSERIQSLVKDAKEKGATIDSADGDESHNLVQPKIISGVQENMRLFKEEQFGPLLAVTTFKDDAEAIRIANSSDYGLAAAVFSKNEGHAYTIARQINAGMVHVNGSTIHDTQTLPHGGWKKSGWGRFNGVYGLQEFTQIKVITINEPHGHYPI